jgi:hypothetical protein
MEKRACREKEGETPGGRTERLGIASTSGGHSVYTNQEALRPTPDPWWKERGSGTMKNIALHCAIP